MMALNASGVSNCSSGVPKIAVEPGPKVILLAERSKSQVAATAAQVLDATGRVVLRQAVPTTAQPQLDTRALAPGLYQLRLFGVSGQPVGQGRFVRE